MTEAEHEEQDTNVNDFDQSYLDGDFGDWVENEYDDDDEYEEGCPDCGYDAVTLSSDGEICSHCGWRA